MAGPCHQCHECANHRDAAANRRPAITGGLRQLRDAPGVESFRVLEKSDLIRLLEPWLGQGNIGEDLPLPLLIEITPDSRQPLNTQALAAEIKAVAPGARLDTHGRWRETLETTANALRLFAVLVLTMVTLATGTVILFATRAGLLANEEILNVLHQIGAMDGYISRRFEAHFTAPHCWRRWSVCWPLSASFMHWAGWCQRPARHSFSSPSPRFPSAPL